MSRSICNIVFTVLPVSYRDAKLSSLRYMILHMKPKFPLTFYAAVLHRKLISSSFSVPAPFWQLCFPGIAFLLNTRVPQYSDVIYILIIVYNK